MNENHKSNVLKRGQKKNHISNTWKTLKLEKIIEVLLPNKYTIFKCSQPH